MKPKPLNILITSIMMLLCVIAADIFINQKAMMKEQNYSQYVEAMSPERQVHEYIQAHTQNNRLLLEALTGSGNNAEFEYRQEIVHPSRLLRLQPNEEQRKAMIAGGVYDAACFDTEIEFVSDDGTVSKHTCTFTFQMDSDGAPWRMASIVFGKITVDSKAGQAAPR